MNFKIKKEWTTNEGYTAVIVLVSPTVPHYCGYIKVPKEHPAYDKHYDDIKISVHGGLTYSNYSNTYPLTSPKKEYWIGFDAAHYNDAHNWEAGKELLEDMDEKELEKVKEVKKIIGTHVSAGEKIRDIPFMIKELEDMSKQLKELEK